MVLALSKDPSARLLKHVVRCYLRLSDNPRYVNVERIMLTQTTLWSWVISTNFYSFYENVFVKFRFILSYLQFTCE